MSVIAGAFWLPARHERCHKSPAMFVPIQGMVYSDGDSLQ